MRKVLTLFVPSSTRLRTGEKFAPPIAVRLVPILLLTWVVPLRAQSITKFFPGFPKSRAHSSPETQYERGSDISSTTQLQPVSIPGTLSSAERSTEAESEHSQQAAIIELDEICDKPSRTSWSDSQERALTSDATETSHAGKADTSPQNAKASSSVVQYHKQPDFNRDIYYRNRTEFALDVGWHPVNIPFIYDFAVGDTYNMTPLKYTLVPIIASLRWHVTNVGWRSIFRGNMDFTFSGSITPIPRGPETHYYSLMFGIRRNFVYRNWRAVPFFEQRGGAGIIDAKEPLGVLWAQGQNLTFTYNMGAGVRYNLNSKYSFSAGMNYMHISNGYLSEPAFKNYGINVYGPMFGMDVRLGKPHHQSSE